MYTSQQLYEVGVFLHVHITDEETEEREVKPPAQGHTASEW